MAKRRRRSGTQGSRRPQPANLRIIGGEFRGRPIRYDGDPRTRPMKDRVREAVFNLVGPAVKGKFVVDLFAGTGAMALEALSRGAARAILIERDFRCARVIEENAESLEAGDRVEVVAANTFLWMQGQRAWPPIPWLVFCCPPYEYYVTQRRPLLELIDRCIDQAPPGSLLVVECDERFETDLLPRAERWDVRRYPPAVIAVLDEVD